MSQRGEHSRVPVQRVSAPAPTRQSAAPRVSAAQSDPASALRRAAALSVSGSSYPGFLRGLEGAAGYRAVDRLRAEPATSPIQPSRLPGGEIVVQRAEKWWPTNDDHTQVTGKESDEQPDGTFVKRAKAGDSDELFSTEGGAWARAKEISSTNRPKNTELYPGTQEKMATGDGNRTYLREPESKKTMSILVTHTTDPQSQLETETGDTLKVTHAHSATGNFAQVKKARDQKKHPKYIENDESKVHYLSLTLQG